MSGWRKHQLFVSQSLKGSPVWQEEIHVIKLDRGIRAHRLQLVGLVIVIDRLVANLPSADPLLPGGMVERAGIAQIAGEACGLRSGGINSVFESEGQALDHSAGKRKNHAVFSEAA